MALDVPLERLQAWEKEGNDQTPTVNQLKRMAERYKRPLSVFYLSAPPKDFLPLRDFRRLPPPQLKRPEDDSSRGTPRVRAALALQPAEETNGRPPIFQQTAPKASKDQSTSGPRHQATAQ